MIIKFLNINPVCDNYCFWFLIMLYSNKRFGPLIGYVYKIISFEHIKKCSTNDLFFRWVAICLQTKSDMFINFQLMISFMRIAGLNKNDSLLFFL